MTAHSRHFRGFRLIALAVLAASSGGSALARTARILPLGEPPPFRQEVRDGVRYEIDPPAELIPPREVFAGPAESGKSGIRLQLGRISAAFSVPAGTGPLAIRGSGEAAAAPWIELPRPETGDFLILTWRTPDQTNWTKPAHLVVPDGAAAPAGSVRIINLFPQAVSIVLSAENLLLEPGKSILRTMPEAAALPFAVVVTGPDGRPKRYFSTTITQNPGERGWIVLHRADGASPRRPLKTTLLREFVPAGAPKEGDTATAPAAP